MISALKKRFASDEQGKLLRVDENGQSREENGHTIGHEVAHAEQNGHAANGARVGGYGTTN